MTTLFSSQARQKSREALLARSENQDTLTTESNEANEIPFDTQQTQFSEDVIISQPDKPILPGTEPVAETGFSQKKYLTLAGLVTGILVVLTLGILFRRPGGNQQNPIILPGAQTASSPELSALQRELVLLEKDVEAADPLQAKLAFPPVNFELQLEDANVRQQRR